MKKKQLKAEIKELKNILEQSVCSEIELKSENLRLQNTIKNLKSENYSITSENFRLTDLVHRNSNRPENILRQDIEKLKAENKQLNEANGANFKLLEKLKAESRELFESRQEIANLKVIGKTVLSNYDKCQKDLLKSQRKHQRATKIIGGLIRNRTKLENIIDKLKADCEKLYQSSIENFALYYKLKQENQELKELLVFKQGGIITDKKPEIVMNPKVFNNLEREIKRCRCKSNKIIGAEK